MANGSQTYMTEFATRVAGIPCKIGVISFSQIEPTGASPWACETDHDFYGSTEVEYDVLDMRGRKADWLAKKVTEAIDSEICEQAVQLLGGGD